MVPRCQCSKWICGLGGYIQAWTLFTGYTLKQTQIDNNNNFRFVFLIHFSFFTNLKEYKLAQFHCYGRYLTNHVQRSLTLGEAGELDADTFYKIHLPNGFSDMVSATMVVGVQPDV